MIINKIGRNDLCPCNSGKKYKKCCMFTKSFVTAEVIDFSLHKLRKTEGEIVDEHLLPFVAKELTDRVIIRASTEFFPSDLPESMSMELLYNNFFIPWLLFNWIPSDDFGIKNFDPNKTIAQNYIALYNQKLSSIQRQFIELMDQTFYSFYSIQEVEYEKGLVIKDILLKTVHIIKEKLATHTLNRGDIIFSRILTLNNQSIFIGTAPYVIPVRYHNDIINYRQWLIQENDNNDLDALILKEESESELINYFFEIIIENYNKQLPTLFNTDGEPVQFSKTYFKLSISPTEALFKLLPLTLSKDPAEFLEDAERNSSGVVVRIEFPWLKKGNKQHKHWDNTVMGNVLIEENKLILETNSEKRNQQGKKLLSKYLGNDIHFQNTLIESPEQMLKSKPTQNGSQMDTKLLELPEVQEQLKQMAKAHWKNWFDEPIPALNNQTPREASRTAKGRELLEALLLEYEQNDLKKSDQMNFFKADINYLKSELKLKTIL